MRKSDTLKLSVTENDRVFRSGSRKSRRASLKLSESLYPMPGVTIGVLIGFQENGQIPLVIFPGQVGDAAVPARSTQDVHGAHIGREVVLVFEGANPCNPIIIGCMRCAAGWPSDQATHVTVESDGARLIVNAKEQMVFQCGKASITLSKAGKVLIQGSYISTRSSGVNRIKGGSVQIN